MSKEYNGLNLKQESIINSINKFCDINFNKFEVDKQFEIRDATRRRVSVVGDEKLFYMDFHFNGNGTTTIEDFGGKEVDIKKKVAFFIKNDDECKIGDNSKNKWFVAKSIENNDFCSILELLKDSSYYKETIDEDKAKGLYQYKGKYNEKLTVEYYSTKTVVLKGRPLLLFNEVMSMITELIDLECIPKLFNDYYKIEIGKDDISEQFKIIMPNAIDKVPLKLQKTLLQAVYNLNLEGDMFDYTYLVFPAFRGLEGHLKYVLKDCSIRLEDDRFNIFDKSNNLYYLKEDYKKCIKSNDKVNHIEKVYNFLHNKRHVYFHWLYPNTSLDQTPVIDNLGHAKTLITDTLSLIEAYYVL